MEEILTFEEELDVWFYLWTSHLDQRFEVTEEKNKKNQRLGGLQYQAQQPSLATEADVGTDS